MATTPYSVAYPVNFRSGGDTTRDAFRKHIDEIERIYGIINAVNADKVSSSGVTSAINSAIAAHQNSTNPHPNWRPSYSFSDITGTIDASKVSGKLTNANIDYGKVNGLGDYVRGLIPAGNGITEKSLDINGGYVKFQNGLILQWGKTIDQHEYVSANIENEATFSKEFPTTCYVVVAQVYHNGVEQTLGAMTSVTGMSKTGFKYIHEKFHASYGGGSNPWYLRYIAIGV